MNPSMPGLPVHHRLPELTQTHGHRVSDASQPSHPRSSPSPPAPISPSIRVFSNESTLRMRWPKYWSFSFSLSPSNEHPGLEDLQDLLEQTPKKDVLFIIGDWNAKIGSQETPGVTGKFGLVEYRMKQGKGQ